MRLARAALCAILLLAVGGLAGCTPAEEGEVTAEEPMNGGEAGEGTDEPMEEGDMAEEDDGMDGEAADQLLLEGELTDEGVECPAFRSDEGDELYTLTGDLAGYGPGDRVRIVATPVEMSFCMQGTTVHVVEISAIEEEAPPEPGV